MQNSNRIRNAVTFICLWFLFLNLSASRKNYFLPEGVNFLSNYTTRELRISPQNWAILQDKSGILYIGNQAGLMQFDGVSWRWLSITNYTVKSMAIGKSGVVYIGGNNELGFLCRGGAGKLEYSSLLKHLPGNYRNFGNVRRTYSTNEGIYFQTRKFLFRWNGKNMKIWEAKGRFYLSFFCNGKLYIRQIKTGLMQMQNDVLVKVPGGDFFSQRSIYVMVPYDGKRLLIGTRNSGFYLYDGAYLEAFPTEADSYLRENKLYYGIRLSSGNFALATLQGGFVIINGHGAIKGLYNRTTGLQDDNVKCVFEDCWNNLWVGLEYGVAKLEHSSPFTFYNVGAGLSGQVLSITLHKGKLIAGTTRGLFIREGNGYFKQIETLKGQCRWLLSTGKSLLVASDEGVSIVNGDTVDRIINSYSYTMLHSLENSNRIWVGTRNGLKSLYRRPMKVGEVWLEEHQFKQIKHKIVTIVENKQGNLWLGTLTQGVWQVKFPKNGVISAALVKRYGTAYHLPDGEINVFFAADHVIFASLNKGILRFDRNKNKFIPDFTLGRKFAADNGSVFRIAEDKKKHIWFHSRYRNYQAVPVPDKEYAIEEELFLRLPDVQVNSIYPDPTGSVVWLGCGDGILGFESGSKKRKRADFPTLIRKIKVNGKTLVFDPVQTKGAVTPPVFSYNECNFTFQFGAPFFEAEQETQFSCFLEGNDERWSSWTREPQSVYTNLAPGDYTFCVRARNVYKDIGRDAVYHFRIFSPWYSNWWAIGFYVLIGILLLFFGSKLRRRKLEKEKQQLEVIVKERTDELKYKNRQLELQTFRLRRQSKKLEELSEVKSRFFANISHEFRTPLTLIMGPIEQMLEQFRGSHQENQLNVVLLNVRRLLNLINQLLDLSTLNDGKMQLHPSYKDIVPFIKGIVAAFHLKAKEKNLKLMFDANKKSVVFSFDGEKMEKIVGNLLINALKYTPAGGSVSVEVDQKRVSKRKISTDMLILSIKDTGLGIPKDQLPHIFERFYRVERFENKELDTGGTGIGLALAEELVELHGGKINVHSGEGMGTEFVILFPLGKTLSKSGEINTIDDEQSDFVESKQLTTLLASSLKEEEEKASHRKEKKKLILVVEDNAEMSDYITQSLIANYSVVKAKNGKEGVKKAKEIIPDLIISDIMMPGVGGEELCRHLKTNLETSHIPIILLTAKASEDNILQGYRSGADDYVTKPFNTQILLTRIQNLIEIRRQLQIRIQEQGMSVSDDMALSQIDKEFLLDLKAIIQKNLADSEFNVEVLCKELYMPKTSLNRKIKALTGETPNQYIQTCRLERADNLLKTGQGNVTEIAFQVGFSSSSYFSRCFKKKFDRLPSTRKTVETLQ